MKNLKFDNACITEKEGQLIITEVIEGKEIERDLINELSVYFGLAGINLKLTKARVKGGGRKPSTKYTCNCGKKLTSSDEDLVVQCLSCGNEFTKPE